MRDTYIHKSKYKFSKCKQPIKSVMGVCFYQTEMKHTDIRRGNKCVILNVRQGADDNEIC